MKKVIKGKIYAFARHCAKLGIDFDYCYWMIFGRYPK